MALSFDRYAGRDGLVQPRFAEAICEAGSLCGEAMLPFRTFVVMGHE
jgi:hypothetical protein